MPALTCRRLASELRDDYPCFAGVTILRIVCIVFAMLTVTTLAGCATQIADRAVSSEATSKEFAFQRKSLAATDGGRFVRADDLPRYGGTPSRLTATQGCRA